MIEINQMYQKEQLIIFGLIIKVNRLKQNMSQQTLCEGICVPSYLSKIENGEIVPSIEMIIDLFESLGITYQDDMVYLEATKQKIEQFYDELNFGGFMMSKHLFKELEAQEEILIHSPLVIDYYLIKFAYYCGTKYREQFKLAKKMVSSVLNQLTPTQKHRYYFYEGLDVLLLKQDLEQAKAFLLKANTFKTSGNSLNSLGIVAYKQKSYFEAVQYLQEAQSLNYKDGNLIAMTCGFEVLGLFSYKLGSFESGIDLLKKARTYASKLGRHDLMIMPLLGMGYMLFYRKEYEKCLSYLNEARMLKHKYEFEWAELKIIDLLYYETTKRLSNKSYVVEAVLSYSNEKIDTAIHLLYLCYHFADQGTQIEYLFNKYKGFAMMNLYLDEIVREAMYDYYVSARKYKEAMML